MWSTDTRLVQTYSNRELFHGLLLGFSEYRDHRQRLYQLFITDIAQLWL